MKILTIGNSFSTDATRYLHDMAKSCGEKFKVANIEIGGCSLRRHYLNMMDDSADYTLLFNGVSTGFKVSIKNALASDEWDYISLQQVSHNAYDYETYQPYLNELVAYIKKFAPHAKILLHETWAYEKDSQRLTVELGFKTPDEMLDGIKKSYRLAKKAVGADGIVPCAEVFDLCLKRGVKKIHRDTFHASFGLGRYTLALTWLCYLTGRNPMDISFNELDEAASPEEILIAKKAVAEVLGL